MDPTPLRSTGPPQRAGDGAEQQHFSAGAPSLLHSAGAGVLGCAAALSQLSEAPANGISIAPPQPSADPLGGGEQRLPMLPASAAAARGGLMGGGPQLAGMGCAPGMAGLLDPPHMIGAPSMAAQQQANFMMGASMPLGAGNMPYGGSAHMGAMQPMMYPGMPGMPGIPSGIQQGMPPGAPLMMHHPGMPQHGMIPHAQWGMADPNSMGLHPMLVQQMLQQQELSRMFVPGGMSGGMMAPMGGLWCLSPGSVDRPRVRSACVKCHERKLRCVVLPEGNCTNCLAQGRVCERRVERRRGRPRSATPDDKHPPAANGVTSPEGKPQPTLFAEAPSAADAEGGDHRLPGAPSADLSAPLASTAGSCPIVAPVDALARPSDAPPVAALAESAEATAPQAPESDRADLGAAGAMASAPLAPPAPPA